MRKKKSTSQRELRTDEKLLWNLVTRTVTPIQPIDIQSEKSQELVEEMASLMKQPIKSAPANTVNLRAARSAAQTAKPTASSSSASKSKHKPMPTPAPIAAHLDKPVYRKIAKGRVAIDSQIDLHDMTQAQAISRLQSFLYQARELGHRHVLVITGKGGSPTSEGVLKRMLPIWLNTPAFSSIVNGYQAASRNHGGDGAFYVRLRRLR
ncbi:MAG: Smr/MutS family protein [Pseudomonadota bacterium]